MLQGSVKRLSTLIITLKRMSLVLWDMFVTVARYLLYMAMCLMYKFLHSYVIHTTLNTYYWAESNQCASSHCWTESNQCVNTGIRCYHIII